MSAPSGGSHKQEHERQEQDLKKEIIISHGLARNIQQGKYGRFDLLSKKGVRWAQTQQKKMCRCQQNVAEIFLRHVIRFYGAFSSKREAGKFTNFLYFHRKNLYGIFVGNFHNSLNGKWENGSIQGSNLQGGRGSNPRGAKS